MMKIWKLSCGNEVKGEGYILNLILYSFFRVFPFFDPRVPLSFSLAARIYKKEFSNLHPSPFYLTFYVSNSCGWRVVKGVFAFFYKHILRIQPVFIYFSVCLRFRNGYLFLESPLFFYDFFLHKLLESHFNRYSWCISR